MFATELVQETSTSLNRLRLAERLSSAEAAVDRIVGEYEAFPPGYPGGYTQLRLDYSDFMSTSSARIRQQHGTITDLIAATFPNDYLQSRGVTDVVALRREYGRYADSKLSAVDDRFIDEVRAFILSRGLDHVSLTRVLELADAAEFALRSQLRQIPRATESFARLVSRSAADRGPPLWAEETLQSIDEDAP